MAKAKDLVLGPSTDGNLLIQFTAENGKTLDVVLSPILAQQLAFTLIHAAGEMESLKPILQLFQIDQIEAGLLDGVPTLSYVAGPAGQLLTASVTESDAHQVIETWGKIDPAAQAAARTLQ